MQTRQDKITREFHCIDTASVPKTTPPAAQSHGWGYITVVFHLASRTGAFNDVKDTKIYSPRLVKRVVIPDLRVVPESEKASVTSA